MDIEEHIVIIKDTPNSNRIIGGIGRDSSATEEKSYLLITEENHLRSELIPCKYCIQRDGEVIEVQYKYYNFIHKQLNLPVTIPLNESTNINVRGFIKYIPEELKIGDSVIISAIPLHKLEVYFKDSKFSGNKRLLRGNVVDINKQLVGVETDTSKLILRRDNVKLSSRGQTPMDNTFKVFCLIK